MKNTRKIIKMM
jgi:hypothetical protein